MKRPLSSPPDPFSVHPLLAILPRRGSLSKLENFRSSLFARHERVVAERSTAPVEEQRRRLQSEEAMLRVVLDWIKTSEGEVK